jgi:hypothetical protein
VLAYQRRNIGGPNRTRVYVKDGHNVTITFARLGHSSYQISLQLAIVDGVAKNHAIELVASSGVMLPFFGCTFVAPVVVIN